MKVTTRKKPAFRDFYENGMFTRIVATKTDKGKWRLFGLHRSVDAAIFVEAARGGDPGVGRAKPPGRFL